MAPRLTRCEMAVIGLSIVCYGLLVAYVHVTGFNVVTSDFMMYYRWSNAWWNFSLRTPSHVPLYSILLWAFRSLTFHLLDAATVMHAVALPFVAGAYFYVHRILRFHFPAARNVGFAVFGLYPFVGYCFAFAPADPLAIFFLVAAAYYSLERKWRCFALCLAAGLISHKATWPFIALLAADGAYGARSARSSGRCSLACRCWRSGDGDSTRSTMRCGSCETTSRASLPRNRRCPSWMGCWAPCCILPPWQS